MQGYSRGAAARPARRFVGAACRPVISAVVAMVVAVSIGFAPGPAAAEGPGSTGKKPRVVSAPAKPAVQRTELHSGNERRRAELLQRNVNLKVQIALRRQQLDLHHRLNRMHIDDLNQALRWVEQFTAFRNSALRQLRAGPVDPGKAWSRETLREKDRLVREINALQGQIRGMQNEIRQARRKMAEVDKRIDAENDAIRRAQAEMTRNAAELKTVEKALR